MKKSAEKQTPLEESQTRTPEPQTNQPAPHPLARLHENVGNQAVLHFLLPIQAKLTIGQQSDPYEQEADRIAEQVTSMSEPQGSVGPGANPHLQMKSAGGIVPAEAPSIVNDVLHSSGQPLDSPTREYFEPRFGQDFSQVRIHDESKAAASADALHAQAYTVGEHVVLGDSQGNNDRKLLAHELAHVVQQRQGGGPTGALQRKAKAIRFQEDPILDDVSEGKKVLKEPDKGEAVIRITTAMHDLGHYAPDTIDENFNPTLTTAVTNYQDSKGLKGKVPAGAVDQTTFVELDNDFSADYKVERDVISKQKSADLLKGTQTIDATEKTAAEKAMSTELQPDPITGADPVFKPTVGKGYYWNRLFWVVEDVIIEEYKMYGKGKQAEHADSKNLYDMADLEVIAERAKKAVDQVFGEYYPAAAHPPFKKNVNLFDAWKAKEDELLVGGKAEEDWAAEWRVEKIITAGDEVKALDKEHGAKQSRSPEDGYIAKVKSDLVKKYRTALIATHKGWPGYADVDNKKVFMQLFKGKDKDGNKLKMWDFFQTLIHEYIHTLESTAYNTTRKGLDEQKGGIVLREGTADYFTKIVWSSITIDDALRKIIEGPYHEPATKVAVPEPNTYGESENAERLAGLVGIRNLAAAFFLGKVDLIGK